MGIYVIFNLLHIMLSRHLSCLLESISASFFKKYFIYLFMRDTQKQRHRQREKQASCEEPDVGLNPRTLGSQLELKADAQPLSHPGAPKWTFRALK